MKIAVIISGQMRDYKVNVINHMEQLINPPGADVFVYACNKNTVHTTGPHITQKYNIISTEPNQALQESIVSAYGKSLAGVTIDENENLDDSDFGTLGYFKRKMNNQMFNIRKGFEMVKEYCLNTNKQYDFIVRLRPDNSMIPNKIDFSKFEKRENLIHSTVYPSGHRDPWFFSFTTPETFNKYCSFVYMDGCDETRTDNNFDCPELALEKYLIKSGIQTHLHQSICRPFYEYDKTKNVVEFPYINWGEKLLDASGKWVNIPNPRN